jgi:geranylgeranyl diphosphate synthase type I
MRPLLAVLSCLAAGGRAEDAAPIATAIELLHNFTLVHDDIQDRSPNRRHRATVWRIWGDAQAINAGDGIFSAAHLAVLQTPHDMLPAESLFSLVAEFNRMTIAIVRGQVLDLGFEGRGDVTPDDYLGMISGKTAAIVRYAAWAGSIVGGATPDVSNRYARMGLALGIGFQIQDDLLGIWGSNEETGKEIADDIRRRKQSLPILLLRSQANAEDAKLLNRLYATDEIDESGIARVLQLLDAYEIQRQVVAKVDEAHDEASQVLSDVTGATTNPGVDGIRELITRMRVRLS